MKQFKLFSTVLLALLISSAAIFNACSKQETSEPLTTGEQPGMSSADQLILKKIFNFRESISKIIDNPRLKSIESTSIDSAVWYLDATLNLSHSFISWDYFNDFHSDSVFVIIPKINNDVNYNDLAIAYDELKQKVAEVCVLAEGADKELYTSTILVKEENESSIILKAEATIGSRGTPPDNHPFNKGWQYGDELGDCSFPPQNVGQDACYKLRDKVNLYRDLYIDDTQMLYVSTPNEEPYVTLHSENQVFDNPNDPDPEDNYYEHLLVYQKEEWNYHDCIEEEQMNWYYHKLNYVLYLMVSNNPIFWPNANGKTFIKIIVDPDHTYGTKDEYIIRHQYKVEYRHGIFVGGNSEPESIVGN